MDFVQYLIPCLFILLDIAVVIVALIKFGKTPVGILVALSFSISALSSITRQILIVTHVEQWWRFSWILTTLSLVSMASLLVGFILVPRRFAVAAPVPPAGGRAYPGSRDDAGPVTPMGTPRTCSKGTYLGVYLTASIVGFVLSGISIFYLFEDEPGTAAAIGALAFLPLVGASAAVMHLVHRMWTAIQGGRARTTPGKAVGYLFVPFYNFYWVFQAFPGWAQDYNLTVREHGLAVPRMPEGLATTYCVLLIIGAIPYVGWALIPVDLAIMTVLISKFCDGINAYAAAHVASRELSTLS